MGFIIYWPFDLFKSLIFAQTVQLLLIAYKF